MDKVRLSLSFVQEHISDLFGRSSAGSVGWAVTEGGIGPPAAAGERVARRGAPLEMAAALRRERDERPAGVEECGFELRLIADQRRDVREQRRTRGVAAGDAQQRSIAGLLALDLKPMRTTAECPQHDHRRRSTG